MTAATTTTVTSDRPSARRRRLLFVGLPAVWVVVALVHPVANQGTIYEDLRDQVGLWLGIHLFQVLLSVGLASSLWLAVRGRSGPGATLTRLALPVYLAFWAAFDSVAGTASALALHHASSLSGAQREGAASTAEYLLDNRIAGDVSAVWAIGQVALVIAVLGVATTLRRAGARATTWGAAGVGVLCCMHAGPPAALGFAALGWALWSAERDGRLG